MKHHDTWPTRRFEQRTLAPLKRLGRRLRGYLLLDGLAMVMVVATTCAAVQLLLDRGWHLPVDMRAALLALCSLVMLWMCWTRMAKPLLRPLDPPAVANLVERRFPELSCVLISAVRFHLGDVGSAKANSPELMSVVLHQASVQSSRLRITDVLNHRRARRSCGLGLAPAAVFAAAFAAG